MAEAAQTRNELEQYLDPKVLGRIHRLDLRTRLVVEGFMAGYWRSPELVFCSGDTVTKGWEETLARYRKRYQSEGREMGRLRFDGVEVIPLGEDAAFARGVWRLRMSDGQEPHGLFTLLLRRVDGAWRIVHDHTSAGE